MICWKSCKGCNFHCTVFLADYRTKVDKLEVLGYSSNRQIWHWPKKWLQDFCGTWHCTCKNGIVVPETWDRCLTFTRFFYRIFDSKYNISCLKSHNQTCVLRIINTKITTSHVTKLDMKWKWNDTSLKNVGDCHKSLKLC